MSQEAELRCRCGQVHGVVADASPRAVSRIVCYCDDCQAYAHHLGRADLLDAHGGTDIVQVAPASLRFDRGVDRIAGVRLTPKGLYRWYATCCRTPVGNTVTPSVPFVGIPALVFEGDGRRAEELFGPPLAAIQGKYAVGQPPPGSTRLRPAILLRVFGKVARWRFGGGAWPHPFFDRQSRAPTRPVTVLSSEEREALRPLCGPRASTA